jgi:hypothetical protein
MEKETYFFYEWLILGKGYTEENLKNATEEEKQQLLNEYREFQCTLKG